MPPDTAERRPRRKGGAPDDALGGGNVPASVTAHGLRREAASRLPPVGDGPVDPLDDITQMPIEPPQPCHGAEFTANGWRSCCRGAA
jgi:hypothetical protein